MRTMRTMVPADVVGVAVGIGVGVGGTAAAAAAVRSLGRA